MFLFCNIRKIRKEKKWSQEELALRCEVSQATISNIENNRHLNGFKLGVFRRICEELETCPFEIITCKNDCEEGCVYQRKEIKNCK